MSALNTDLYTHTFVKHTYITNNFFWISVLTYMTPASALLNVQTSCRSQILFSLPVVSVHVNNVPG